MWICCGAQLSCPARTQTGLFLSADTWRNSAQSSVPCLCSINVLSTGPTHASTGTLLTSVVADLSAVGMAPLTIALTFTAPNTMRPQGSALKEMSKLLKVAFYLTLTESPVCINRGEFINSAFKILQKSLSRMWKNYNGNLKKIFITIALLLYIFLPR